MKRSLATLLFSTVLTAVFITMKLSGYINWDWIGVLAPLSIGMFSCLMNLGIRWNELRILRKRSDEIMKKRKYKTEL